jgi:hypothetical protein
LIDLIRIKIDQTIARGQTLLLENELSDWTITTNKKRCSLAETLHQYKVISFSRYFLIIATKKQYDEATLHEIAHALVGPGKGHGSVFMEQCKKLCTDEQYISDAIDYPIRKYTRICPRCGQRGGYHTNNRLRCAPCFKEGHLIELDCVKNQLELVEW